MQSANPEEEDEAARTRNVQSELHQTRLLTPVPELHRRISGIWQG